MNLNTCEHPFFAASKHAKYCSSEKLPRVFEATIPSYGLFTTNVNKDDAFCVLSIHFSFLTFSSFASGSIMSCFSLFIAQVTDAIIDFIEIPASKRAIQTPLIAHDKIFCKENGNKLNTEPSSLTTCTIICTDVLGCSVAKIEVSTADRMKFSRSLSSYPFDCKDAIYIFTCKSYWRFIENFDCCFVDLFLSLFYFSWSIHCNQNTRII